MLTIVARLRAAGCVFAEDEARLLESAATDPPALEAMVDRRVAGEPLEHILGWAEFLGSRVAVHAGVFVPRRRTEFLVEQAVTGLRAGAVVVDLCCGCGAVAAALAAAVPGIEVHAVDIDPAAVRCARHNLPGGHVYAGDLYRPLPRRLRGHVDLLIANAPYVPTAELGLLPAEARDHEPRVALDGGADGLDVVRRVISAAPPWLAPGGRLLIETSRHQAPAILDAIAAAGLLPRLARSDERDATVAGGHVETAGGASTSPASHRREAR